MTCLSHLNVDSSQTFFPFFSVSLCFCQALFYPLPITSFSHFSILFNSLDFSFLSLPYSLAPTVSQHSAVSISSFYSKPLCVSVSHFMFLDSQGHFFLPSSVFVCQSVFYFTGGQVLPWLCLLVSHWAAHYITVDDLVSVSDACLPLSTALETHHFSLEHN